MMRALPIVFAVLTALLLCLPNPAWAGTTDTGFTYQGRLRSGGLPATGDFAMTFSLWDAELAGAQIGAPVGLPAVSVSGGVFAVELDFGVSVYNGMPRWLEIEVDGQTLSPRQAITGSPYAIQTRGMFVDDQGEIGIGTNAPWNDLAILSGGLGVFDDVGDGVRFTTDGFAIDRAFNEDPAYEFDGTTDEHTVYSGGAPSLRIDGNGDVSIGFGITPAAKLHVETGAHADAIYGMNTQAAGNVSGIHGETASSLGRAVFGEATATAGSNAGVRGESESTAGSGVHGIANAVSGVSFGVRGDAFSSSGRGVFGSAASASGTTSGVWGSAISPGGRGVYGFGATGVLGQSNSSMGVGVQGLATGADGTGVYAASSAATGNGIALHAVAGSPTGYSGYFEGGRTYFDGNVGLGVTDPTSPLAVAGFSASGTGLIDVQVLGSGGFGVRAQTSSASGTAIFGETSPDGPGAGAGAGISGSSHVRNGRGVEGYAEHDTENHFGVYGSAGPTGYDFYAGGLGMDYGSPSSIRWKRNVEPIHDPLALVAQMRGVYFDWDEEHGGRHAIGFIGEEVGVVLPEVVAYETDGEFVTGMDYAKVTPLLVEAVKALNAENQLLRERLEKIESQMSENLKPMANSR
ncbi:MAG: tail fiber domain-containing protein [Phycisphaerales bacterium]|nr:tail fiber domain-containing protein [Phycisphaerales bacterium]